MTITVVKEIAQQRRSRSSLSGRRSTIRAWRIQTNSNYDDPETIEADVSFPVTLAEVHPNNGQLYVETLDTIQLEQTSRLWISTATYSNARDQVEANPLDEPTDYTWSSQNEDVPIRRDRNGKLYANSAGDVIRGATKLESYWVLTARKNLVDIPSWLVTSQNKINSASFTVQGLTIGAGDARIHSIEIGRARTRNDQAYFAVAIQVHIKRDGWSRFEADEGLRRIDPEDDTKRIPILNDDGTDVTIPVPLDAGQPVDDPDNTTVANVIEFDIYDETDFSAYEHFTA